MSSQDSAAASSADNNNNNKEDMYGHTAYQQMYGLVAVSFQVGNKEKE
jgi:hypothetical protein